MELILNLSRNTRVAATRKCVMSYGGEVSAKECWAALSQPGENVLVDVRTQAEWTFVGMPSMTGDTSEIVGQQWQIYPQMAVDPAFASTLSEQLEAKGYSKDVNLFFLCRSGVRSLAAAQAMTAIGYANTFNITHGFEGSPNGEGHRGTINGWKADGLPWRQG